MVVETNGRALARQDEPIRDVASIDLSAIERVVVAGDLSKLSAPERWDYYRGVCQSVGLNPFTKPFEYITLNGKLTLYALKGATDQLRRLYGLSISEPTVKMSDGLCIVTVTGTDARGRSDSEIGAVVLPPGGEARANALMKALTKAKRRLTLSMCGLGMLDESEVETIPNATRPVLDAAPAVELNPDAVDVPAVPRWKLTFDSQWQKGVAMAKSIGASVPRRNDSSREAATACLADLHKAIEARRQERTEMIADITDMIARAKDMGASFDVPDNLEAESTETLAALQEAILSALDAAEATSEHGLI